MSAGLLSLAALVAPSCRTFNSSIPEGPDSLNLVFSPNSMIERSRPVILEDFVRHCTPQLRNLQSIQMELYTPDGILDSFLQLELSSTGDSGTYALKRYLLKSQQLVGSGVFGQFEREEFEFDGKRVQGLSLSSRSLIGEVRVNIFQEVLLGAELVTKFIDGSLGFGVDFSFQPSQLASTFGAEAHGLTEPMMLFWKPQELVPISYGAGRSFYDFIEQESHTFGSSDAMRYALDFATQFPKIFIRPQFAFEMGELPAVRNMDDIACPRIEVDVGGAVYKEVIGVDAQGMYVGELGAQVDADTQMIIWPRVPQLPFRFSSL